MKRLRKDVNFFYFNLKKVIAKVYKMRKANAIAAKTGKNY